MFSGVFTPSSPTTLHNNSLFFGFSGVEQPMNPLRLLNLGIRSGVTDHRLSFDIVSGMGEVADGFPLFSGWE